MISGLKNLEYLSRGMRLYGEQPVLPRQRGRWEFQFILKGRARPIGVDCSPSMREQPRFYVFHSRSLHGWTDEKRGVSEVFVVQYGEVPDELADAVGPAKPLMVELDDLTAERMKRRQGEAMQMAAAGGLGASLYFQRLLMELTTLALSGLVKQPRKIDGSDKVALAMNWFEENVAGSPTVEAAAAAAGVSAAHLRRLFADAGRPSPQAELIRLRMDTAKRCLLDGWTHKAVAELLGFSEASAFARAFRDHAGMPPGVWMRASEGTKA